jgi:hypothetical protein
VHNLPEPTRSRRHPTTNRPPARWFDVGVPTSTLTFAPLVEHIPHHCRGSASSPIPQDRKVWLAASIALACAQGGTALNSITVQARAVLLALEDGPRRLQARMRRLNHDQPLPARLHILTKVQPGTVTAPSPNG